MTAMIDVALDIKLLPIYVALIAGLFALAGGVVGSFTTAHFALRNQLRFVSLQNRQRAYAEIMGKRVLLMQLFVSRFEAYIYSDFHEQLWRLAGHPKESLDFDEAKKWMHKSEDLALEIARTKQSLFESIGIARAAFPQSQELDQLTENIYHFKSPKIAASPKSEDQSLLVKWKEEAVGQLQVLVEREYGAPLETLLRLLSQNMYARAK